jgi:hypothetical protein
MTVSHQQARPATVPAQPENLHQAIRRAVANLERARVRFRKLDAELDALIEATPHEDGEPWPPVVQRFEKRRLDPATKAVESAWKALSAAMKDAGCNSGAVIVNGMVYCGDGCEWLDDAICQTVFPVGLLLNLDATTEDI